MFQRFWQEWLYSVELGNQCWLFTMFSTTTLDVQMGLASSLLSSWSAGVMNLASLLVEMKTTFMLKIWVVVLRRRCKRRLAWWPGGGRPSLGRWGRGCRSQGPRHRITIVVFIVIILIGNIIIITWEMMPFSRTLIWLLQKIASESAFRSDEDFSRLIKSDPQGCDLGDPEVCRHRPDRTDSQDCLRCQHWGLWVATGRNDDSHCWWLYFVIIIMIAVYL